LRAGLEQVKPTTLPPAEVSAMPDTRLCKVTIFVCSPIDVAPERGRVQAVTAKLNREYEGLVRFKTVLWEEHFYTADKSFRPQIPQAVASDIVVSIFWTRIGTELPAHVTIPKP
jgi:hypothetical protein